VGEGESAGHCRARAAESAPGAAASEAADRWRCSLRVAARNAAVAAAGAPWAEPQCLQRQHSLPRLDHVVDLMVGGWDDDEG